MSKEGPMQRSERDSRLVANFGESLFVDLFFQCRGKNVYAHLRLLLVERDVSLCMYR